MILTHLVLFGFLGGATAVDVPVAPPVTDSGYIGGVWPGTVGERKRKKREEAEDQQAQAVVSRAVTEDPQAKINRALERDIRGIQDQLSSLQDRLEAARIRAVRSEIDRLEQEIQSETAKLIAIQIEDENAAIALILGMVL